MKTVIIQGSARSIGNTHKVVALLRKQLECDLIDLKKYRFGHYDYQRENADDDFLPLMKKIPEYDLIIFATPVYWYSMSGLMKMFFDRITDCLKIDKETGRKLRGKSMAALACGSEEVETEGFFVPFSSSAEYLGMNYLGHIHTWIEEKEPSQKVIDRINTFAKQLK